MKGSTKATKAKVGATVILLLLVILTVTVLGRKVYASTPERIYYSPGGVYVFETPDFGNPPIEIISGINTEIQVLKEYQGEYEDFALVKLENGRTGYVYMNDCLLVPNVPWGPEGPMYSDAEE